MEFCRRSVPRPRPKLGSKLNKVLQTAPKYNVELGNKSIIALFPKTPDSTASALSTYAWLIDTSVRSRNSLHSENESLEVEFLAFRSYKPDSVFIQIRYTHSDRTIKSVKVRVHVAGNTTDRITDWTPVENRGESSTLILRNVLTSEFEAEACLVRDLVYRNALKLMIQLDHPVTVANKNIYEDKEQQNALVTTKKMYDKKLFADVEICVKKTGKDGVIIEKKIPVHKAVIAARSSVFEALLLSSYVENELNVIEITDFEPTVVEELFKFLYIGKVDLENNAVELLKIADKYDVPELMSTCQEYISQHIPKFGWSCIFELLHLYNPRVPVLRENVKEYFERYEATLKKSPDFRAATRLFPLAFDDIYFP